MQDGSTNVSMMLLLVAPTRAVSMNTSHNRGGNEAVSIVPHGEMFIKTIPEMYDDFSIPPQLVASSASTKSGIGGAVDW